MMDTAPLASSIRPTTLLVERQSLSGSKEGDCERTKIEAKESHDAGARRQK